MQINKIICGDAGTKLKLYTNKIDLIVTSPPYDGLRSYKGFNFDFDYISQAIYDSLKPGGVLVWVVSDATISGTETGSSFSQALHFKKIGLNLHDTMIFKKINAIPQIYRKRYTNEFEYMFVFSKGPVSTHNPIRIPCLHAGLELKSTTYKNYSKGDQKRKKLANPVKKDKIKGNIWEYVVGKKKEDQLSKGHPAPFPFQLAVDHILSWSNEGDLVCDPMCGSGTTCVAAKILGRNYLGIDVSREYCDLARQRIKDQEAVPKLF